MNAVVQPLFEVSQRARSILIQELGVIDAMRFLNQFQVGSGDYSVEREKLFKDDTVKSIVAEIKAHRDEKGTLPFFPLKPQSPASQMASEVWGQAKYGVRSNIPTLQN